MRIIVLNVGHVLTNAHMGFTKKTVKSLLSYIPRDALINVEVARRYVRQKRSSILEIRVETSQLAAAVAGTEVKPVGDVPNGAHLTPLQGKTLSVDPSAPKSITF